MRLQSYCLEMIIDESDSPRNVRSIWDLAFFYSDQRCANPLDRVFGLLPLARPTCREAIRPDYSKSVMEVMLQLVERKIRSDAEDSEGPEYRIMENYWQTAKILGAFGLGPETAEMAVMLHQRQIRTDEDDSCSSQVPQDLISALDDSRRMALNVSAYCKVGVNESGECIAPLFATAVSSSTMSSLTRRGFEIEKNDTGDAVILQTPAGTVSGLANKQIQAGDILLFFWNARSDPPSCLIVRPFEGKIHSVIGQCIVDSGTTVCSNRFKTCMCGGEPALHSTDGSTWKVHMSPEDLIFFIAQDLKMEHTQPGKFEEAVWEFSVFPEERARRVSTRVTHKPFSSFAVLGSER